MSAPETLFGSYVPPQFAPHLSAAGWDSPLTRQVYGDPNGAQRAQVANYGGGTQTSAMVALCITGRLPWPDHWIMADTGREATATWDWLYGVIMPALASHERRVEIAPHNLATVDLLSHKGKILMPMWTTQSGKGKVGQLRTYCSFEWKVSVVQRYLTTTYGYDRVDNWLGFSSDESSRLNPSGKNLSKWRTVWPLLDLGLSRDDCQSLVKKVFGKPAPKSSCWMCPHRGDAQWRELKAHYPSDFAAAVAVDHEMRQHDPYVYLHRSGLPLDLAPLGGESGQIACDAAGGCWT